MEMEVVKEASSSEPQHFRQSRPRHHKSSRLPARWEPYTPVGNPIEGTRFISFKVPLKELYCNKLPETLRFSPDDLVSQVLEKGQELGLVIDFTFTDRYYDASDITDKGIQYQKIKTAGHAIPAQDIMDRFSTVVDNFLEENAENDKLIGVHCTHGVNRTGYIVCKYMIDRLQIDPDVAIEAFNKARGHDIERPNYLCGLRGGTAEEIADLEKKDGDHKPNNSNFGPYIPRVSDKANPQHGSGRGNNRQGRGSNGESWRDRGQSWRDREQSRGDNGQSWRDREQSRGDNGQSWRDREQSWRECRQGYNNQEQGFGNRARTAHGFGNTGQGWGNHGQSFDNQGPGWGYNTGSSWGITRDSHQHKSFGYQHGSHEGSNSEVGFGLSNQDRLMSALSLQQGYELGVQAPLRNGGPHRSHQRRHQGTRQKMTDKSW